MTTVIIPAPSGSNNLPVTIPANNKSVLMSVAVDTTKETLVTDTDSPTSTSIDMTIESNQDEDVEVEAGQFAAEDDDGNAEEIVNGILDESAGGTHEQWSNKKRRRVLFECADIVEFEPTIYTTSVTSGGVPVGLSLNERSRSRRRLDSFEMEREDVRVGRQHYMEEGYLDPQERKIILNNAGCEVPVIASVEAEVNAIIQHRRESNEVDFGFMYGVGEFEEVEEESIEEDEEVMNMLTNAQEDAGDAVPRESKLKQGGNREKDALVFDNAFVSQELKIARLEKTADLRRDDEPEAASI